MSVTVIGNSPGAPARRRRCAARARWGRAPRPVLVECDQAGPWAQGVVEHVKQGRLPRAIGADQADHGAPSGDEADVGE